MKKILILGSSGMLGSSLKEYFGNIEVNATYHGRGNLDHLGCDLLDCKELHRLLIIEAPDVIINLAGETNVDSCEHNINKAFKKNVQIIENLRDYFTSSNPSCHLIQISTDHLYDSNKISSEDELNIQNVYALSKYAGELVTKSITKNHTILRTNFFGKSKSLKKQSISDWIFDSATSENRITVFSDVHFSPISMLTLSWIINEVVQKRIFGLYNIGSRDGVSKADFAFKFAESLNLNTKNFKRAQFKISDSMARRPKDMRMDVSLFEATFNMKAPTLLEEIQVATREYKEIKE